MTPIDYADVIAQARLLRAREMQRYQGLLVDRLGLFFRLLGGSLLAGLGLLGAALRPLFAWNPRPH